MRRRLRTKFKSMRLGRKCGISKGLRTDEADGGDLEPRKNVFPGEARSQHVQCFCVSMSSASMDRVRMRMES